MKLKTRLYEEHLKLNGKVVPFAGYLLPVQYSGVIEEHLAVRNDVGLFDVSHMGEIIIKGKGSLNTINYLFTNDFTNMQKGRVRYSVMCNKEGGCIDDLLVYKFDDDYYYIVVNAANRHIDFKHMQDNLLDDTTIEDISDNISQVALQGPKAKDVMLKLLNEEDLPNKYYSFKNDILIDDIKCLISFTGYTGENGYEIYVLNDDVIKLWHLLLDKGQEFNLKVCGLGARDTLRLEASMPLYGHEMNENISPLETGLDFGVKMQKDDFIGKEAIINKGEPMIKRVGLQIIDKGVLRENQEIYIEDKMIGHTTSGTFSPLFKTSIAMALIDKKYSDIDNIVEVDVRGRRLKAKIVEMPFYKKK